MVTKACKSLSRAAYYALLAAFVFIPNACRTTQTSLKQPTSSVSSNCEMGSAPLIRNPTKRLTFHFRSIDGTQISSDRGTNSFTVIAFVSTFDWASQAQARFLSTIFHKHRDKVHCFAIAVEQPENRLLIESFKDTLSLSYPVVHIPSNRLTQTDFHEISTVPTVWILDSLSRVVWKSSGLASDEVITNVLGQLDQVTSHDDIAASGNQSR